MRRHARATALTLDTLLLAGLCGCSGGNPVRPLQKPLTWTGDTGDPASVQISGGALGFAPQGRRTALPDVVVRAVSYDPASGAYGCTVTNLGRASTPAGVDIGVAYLVDGEYRTWGSAHDPLAPGASVAIGSEGGSSPIAAGTHTVTAWVDDVNRFRESNEGNNQLAQQIEVPGAAPPPTPVPVPAPPPPTPQPPTTAILWHDGLQTTASAPWGFDGLAVEHPIGTDATGGGDAAGASLTRVLDPLGAGGFAMRHYATFDNSGSRSQAGIYSFANAAFAAQAKSREGIWVAQEWYFPQRMTAQGDNYAWMNLWDWHSTDDGGGNRWHTSPGLMLAEDGSMRVKWEWGGPASSLNPDTGLSAVALPVGRWLDVEMHYTWTTGTTTLSLWIDGVLALEQSGVQTRAPSHSTVETYMKFYGSSNGGTPWTPTQAVKYTRNVRVAGSRIWH
jgi:hypothetical protein